MPVFNFYHWSKELGYTLEESGPILPVTIGIPTALEEFCVEKGFQIPPAASGYALIDTGVESTRTAIFFRRASLLLEPINFSFSMIDY